MDGILLIFFNEENEDWRFFNRAPGLRSLWKKDSDSGVFLLIVKFQARSWVFFGRVRFSKFRAGLLEYLMLNLISDLFKVPSYE